VAHLEENVAAAELTLAPEEIERLDAARQETAEPCEHAPSLGRDGRGGIRRRSPARATKVDPAARPMCTFDDVGPCHAADARRQVPP